MVLAGLALLVVDHDWMPIDMSEAIVCIYLSLHTGVNTAVAVSVKVIPPAPLHWSVKVVALVTQPCP